MARRDIIVIGASAGGVEPLRTIVADLRPDLPASVFVVLHLAHDRSSSLPEVLDHAGPLEALPAQDGAKIEQGKIYVAVPDHHLLLDNGRIRVTHGPQENRHRPSIDVLFRSAAKSYGSRVIGVILSGSLDDGTAGLIAIKIRGGLAITQDPAEAFSADMPRNASRYIDVDSVSRARDIGGLLNDLVTRHVDPEEGDPPSPEMVEESRIAALIPRE